MTVFFDCQIQTLSHDEKFIDFCWHKSHELLAVASFSHSQGQVVAIFQEEGERLQNSIQRKTQPATYLSWHPVKKILAVGWGSGEITLRNENDNETYDVAKLHQWQIAIMHWSTNGSQLISGDNEGTIIIWKADVKGRLSGTPLMQQNISDQLTHIVIIQPPPQDPKFDLHNLAKLAVSGDQSALDMFTWRKGSKLTPGSLGPTEGLTYFVGGSKGVVYYVDNGPKVVEKFKVQGSVKKLLFYDDKNILVVLSSQMMVTLLSVHMETRDATEIMSVKINGQPQTTDMVWTGPGLLATCMGEKYIRMWDIDKEENYILNLNSVEDGTNMGIVTSISFSNKGVLSCGTDQGKVVQWKFMHLFDGNRKKEEPEDDWQLQNVSTVAGTILDIGFGSSKNLLAVNTGESVHILNEQDSVAVCCEEMTVVQTGGMLLSVDDYSNNNHFVLKTDIQVKSLCCTKDSLAVTNGKKVVVYDISGGEKMLKVVGTFNTTLPHLAIHQLNLYAVEPGKVQVRNFQGTVKQLLPLVNADDELLSMEVCGSFLVVVTNQQHVKVFDLSRREAKVHAGPKQFVECIEGMKGIVSAKCNNNATKVSLLVSKKDGSIDPRIHIWDTETNSLQYFNFAVGKDDVDDHQVAKSQMIDSSRTQSANEISGRYPISHHWDTDDPKLFVCEAKFDWDKKGLGGGGQEGQGEGDVKGSGGSGGGVGSGSGSKAGTGSKKFNKMDISSTVDVMVVTLFCTSEHGVLVQDHYSKDQHCSKLISINIPFYYFILNKIGSSSSVKEQHKISNKTATTTSTFSNGQLPQNHPNQQSVYSPNPNKDSASCRRIHRNFIGIDLNSKDAREAMTNFSFFLTMGDMDEAFKAIKLIKSESVWENMAKMCVKTRRLDVAKVCLGNMKDPWGVKLLRESMAKEPEDDAQIACLAIQLGLIDDAERLLKNCKRFDLLNKLYQNTEQWDKALAIAESHDRINLRNTNYNYAKYLESRNNLQEAAKFFEKSETHGFEVPHMFLNDIKSFHDYVNKSNDKSILKWWAQYLENSGNIEESIKFYNKSQDYLSLARLYCSINQIEKAAQVCDVSKDKAACYWVGTNYEKEGKMQEAINYYNRAQAFGNAIRLCKDHSYDDKLLNMAIMGNTDDMLEAARYYEDRKGFEEKAALLYHKAGYSSRALELAFASKQYAVLHTISESFDDNTDPLLLQRCAEFFIDNSQFDRAVDLLASAKKYAEAFKICREKHVQMDEDLVEKLSPSENATNLSTEERNKILEGIGDVCMEQRQYHLATKKYTQSGNRVKAMKALLKSGDTEKICFFANVSRQKEIYIMAGHYLQSLDWQKDPEIMKNIINFYTKGRSQEHLAGFYAACAQLEIDEYKDYEKALGALSEAYKCLSKCKTNGDDGGGGGGGNETVDTKLNKLKERMTVINKFVKAKNAGPEEAMQVCQALLTEPKCDEYIKVGDILAYMTGYFAKTGKWKKAYSCIEELQRRQPNVDLTFYMEKKLIVSVYNALNLEYKDFKFGKNAESKADKSDDEIQEDEIPVD